MFDFLIPICIVGGITLAIYKVFELYAHRRERIMMLEKLSDEELSKGNLQLPALSESFSIGKFTSLRWGCLLCGLGLGLVVGAFFYINMKMDYDMGEVMLAGSVMLFGGLGLLIASIVETQMNKKRD
ncbi:MAG: hypothetical protein LBM61_00870 [Prevotellaceae bacterium]|jgi:hypothetical protein|nr:hypothetical protein [Prevotellaceae bacterium]